MRDVLEDVAVIAGDDLALGDAGVAHGSVAGGYKLGTAEAGGAPEKRRAEQEWCTGSRTRGGGREEEKGVKERIIGSTKYEGGGEGRREGEARRWWR